VLQLFGERGDLSHPSQTYLLTPPSPDQDLGRGQGIECVAVPARPPSVGTVREIVRGSAITNANLDIRLLAIGMLAVPHLGAGARRGLIEHGALHQNPSGMRPSDIPCSKKCYTLEDRMRSKTVLC